MVGGIACFAAMDTVGKWLVQTHSVFQVLAMRSLVATGILLVLMRPSGGRKAIETAQPWAHALRALCAVLAFLFFFTSLRFLPLADAVAVAFGGPFIVTALSVPFLGERVRLGQWVAIAFGFVGMLLIVQPTGAGFQPAALFVVASSLAYAFVMILTRWMARRSRGAEKTFAFLFYTFIAHSAVGVAGTLGRFVPMSTTEMLLGGAMGALAVCGHFGITRAFQLAPVSAVAPFEYTALVWASLLGFVVFREFPGANTWLGVAIIVAAGLYTIRAERDAEPE